MRKILIILLLLLCAIGFTIDPPAIVWTKEFFEESYGEFHDVHETSDGGYIVAGGHLLVGGGSGNRSLYKFSESGDSLWSAGSTGFEYQAGYWVGELSDGSLVTTGACGIIGEPTSAVLLFKADSDGNQIWTKAFDFPGTNDRGNCVVPLDDGFAIAGTQGNKAWIIRTDLQGDSLWSATYQDSYPLHTRRILQVDNALIVFYTGVEVGILAYSIDDGQLLWEADDYPSDFGGYVANTGDITSSTTDNGFTFVTTNFPYIVHTDSLGNLLWHYEIPYTTVPYGYSLNNTMDGGYIYCGVNTPDPDIPGSQYSGMVVKYDSEGIWQWRDYVYECLDLFSIRQLSSGGYIACGGEGTAELIRYAPETGIEAESNTNATCITSLAPNPFSSTLNIQFNLAESSIIELSIYDLTGRIIDTLEQGSFPAGEYSSSWIPEEISSGCYLVRLTTPEGGYAKNCVFIP